MKEIRMKPSTANVASFSGGCFDAPPGSSWELTPPKKFGQSKFYLITKGSCDMTIDGESFIGTKGSLFFIPKGATNSYKNDTGAPFSHYWTHFDIYPEVESPLLENGIYHVNANDTVWELFSKYAEVSRRRSVADLLTEKALLTLIIAEYIRLSGQDTEAHILPQNETIDRILYYTSEHISERITNLKLAEISHMHPTHFIRFFKEKTGMTPQNYVKQRRIELAKRLLEESDISISEIMLQIGYDDPSRFSKNFRELTGDPPLAYRKKIRRMAIKDT